MSVDTRVINQLSLFENLAWSTTVRIEPDHRLVTLCKSIFWEQLMENAIPILYNDYGISPDTGRALNLRAHLGAYILQTTYGWTDRWTEEMIRFYIPARLFCGYADSTGSLDHTKIEEFRNRFGEKGARLITEDMLKVAKAFGLTEPSDVDMDTTVQGAGITHPTEMKLMNHLIKRLSVLHGIIKGVGGRGIAGIKSIAVQFKKCLTECRFFAKDKQKKADLIHQAKTLAERGLEALGTFLPGQTTFDRLHRRYQQEILRFQSLGPELMDQIEYWLRTDKVAKDKIVNCYRGGYMLVMAHTNPKISDQHCVVESLSLHNRVFEQMPKTYGTDRAMWSTENLELCLSAGVEKIAIQPKGKSQALVSRPALQELSNRRAGIEPRIGHLKTRGLGRSRMKSDVGDLISGYRSALSWNLSLLMRDLSLQPALVTQRK